MNDDLISVLDVAAQHGKRKQTVFKILKRLGIETTKQRSSAGKNQLVSYITQEEFKRVRGELLSILSDDESDDEDPSGIETASPSCRQSQRHRVECRVATPLAPHSWGTPSTT